MLFGIAEEIGKVWDLLGDPLRILPLLEKLCAVEETVVRDEVCVTVRHRLRNRLIKSQRRYQMGMCRMSSLR